MKPLREVELPRFPPARTLASLCANTAEILWTIYLLGVAGCLTLLVAREKAGKSTLLFSALKAHATAGGFWLARVTQSVVAVIITEEGDTTIRSAAGKVGLLESTSIHIISARSMPGASWDDVVAHAISEVDRLGATFLGIDTIPGVAGLPEKGENDSGVAQLAMRPLREALQARPGLAIVATMHANKAVGRGVSRPSDMLRGSTGWASIADVLVGLNFHPRDPRTRVLTFEGRVDTPGRVDVTLGADGVYELAQPEQEEAQEVTADPLACVPTSGHGITASEYMVYTGATKPTAHRILKAAFEDGRLRRAGDGSGRSAYRYTRYSTGEEVADA